MKFTLTIESSNAAVVGEGAEQTLADMIAAVAKQVEDGCTSGYVRDYSSNGPAIGYWEYTPEADELEGTDDEIVCRHCGEPIFLDDNGNGGKVWSHDFGSTVCYDDPPGSIEDGDTATTAAPYRLHYTSADGPGDDSTWSVYVEDMPNGDTDRPIEGSARKVSTHATEAEADAEATRLQQKED